MKKITENKTLNKNIMSKTIALNTKQTQKLHEICSYADAELIDNELHLIGLEASHSVGGSTAEAIGQFYNIKKMLVDFLASVEDDVRKLEIE